MDPNQTLADIHEAIADMKKQHRPSEFGYMEAAERLVYSVQALDEWLSNGGFLPKAWARE